MVSAQKEVRGLDVNPQRLKYLIDLYKLTNKQFLSLLHQGRKRTILTEEELQTMLTKPVHTPLSTIKAIDKIFNKGISWFITKRALPERTASIFFRKKTFNSELNMQSIRIASQFEEKKYQIQNLCANISFTPKRKIKNFTVQDNPQEVAKLIKKEFDTIQSRLLKNKVIRKPQTERDNLRNLMATIEDYNIFVFEFLETHNQKNLVNFDGFFIKPNVIVLKKQEYQKREIFTLMHEFAHYLLDVEEIDEISEKTKYASDQELWCNNFVYYFLIGEHHKDLISLEKATLNNRFQSHELNIIAQNSLISISSLYTRMRILDKIDEVHYQKILDDIAKHANKKRLEEKQRNRDERRKMKELGIENNFGVKPIQSKLFKEIVKINYFQGSISENTLCDYLKIKPDKVAKEVY